MVAQSKSRVAASTSEEAAAAATVLQLRARDSRFDGNLVGEVLFSDGEEGFALILVPCHLFDAGLLRAMMVALIGCVQF